MLVNEDYPLGHSANEMGRLELQAKLFEDPLLSTLATHAQSCLEIGAGIGSNWPMLASANPALIYKGIDRYQTFVDAANAHHRSSGASFEVMDARVLDFPEGTFDLVFSKLVLWSLGSNSIEALQEAFRVLKLGGTFYAFEPFDRGVVFEPSKPALESWIKSWDGDAIQKGLDPFIGPKISLQMEKIGFEAIETQFFPVLATTADKKRYSAVCDNLRKFYFGNSIARKENILSKTRSLAELLDEGGNQLVMDAFFVTVGKKPFNPI